MLKLAKGLKSCDLNHKSKDRDGKQAIDLELDIHTNENDPSSLRPLIQAHNSNEETQLIYDGEMVWMEAKQGANDCILLSTTFNIVRGEKQKKLYFPRPVKTEVEVEHWIQDFRFSTDNAEPYACDFWASNVTAKGFTANASGSKNAERLAVTWIVYKKGKRKVMSGTFSTDDIEDRGEAEVQNSGRVEFPEGRFQGTPTVLVGLSQFDLAGGRDLRIGVRASGVSNTGFTWHLGESARQSMAFANS